MSWPKPNPGVAVCLALLAGLVAVLGAGVLGIGDAAAQDAGERAFVFCVSCHAVGADDPAGQLGPRLDGIVGRRVAGLPGYDYSPALRAFAQAEPVWTAELLDRFIEKPHELVPDTTMAFFGIASSSRRKALVEYLKERK